MPIIWEMPDGTIKFTTLSEKYLAANRRENEPTDSAVLRLAVLEQTKLLGVEGAKSADLARTIPRLVTTANMPTDRANRSKWRLRGNAVVVEP